MSQNDLVAQIENSINQLIKYENQIQRQSFGDWEDRFLRETDKLIDKNKRLIAENLLNFRGKQIFVADRPTARFKSFYSNSKLYYGIVRILNLIIGSRRGELQEAKDSFESIQESKFLDLLKEYPSPEIGHPLNINYKGYVFTNRYIRHIYNLGLFKKYIQSHLHEDAVVMDIGCSYGIFSSLVKQEMKKSHHVLVDMPGQLILAHYYLGKLFPDAKIADFSDVGIEEKIDKAFITNYDFVLVPTSMYGKLSWNSVDMVTNFISLSEMSREWFDTYIRSEVFKTAPFLFTINRYDAYPTYQNNITILDYPLNNYEPIFMRICPFLRHFYKGYLFFWYKAVDYPSNFFQFIGKRQGL